jgi:alkylhydroperoxidase family enzyme
MESIRRLSTCLAKGFLVARIPDAQLPPDLKVHNNLVRATYNNPEMFKGFASLSGRVHSASHLPDRTRELVVLRVSAMLGSDVEWGQHLPSAFRVGISESEAREMRDGIVTSLDPAEAAAIRFAEAVESCGVDDAAWATASEHYSPVELMDLALLAEFYALASRLTLALDVNVDEGLTRINEL